MGANDAAEQLQVAIETNIESERQIVALQAELAERDVLIAAGPASLDAAFQVRLVQRGGVRSCNPRVEFEAGWEAHRSLWVDLCHGATRRALVAEAALASLATEYAEIETLVDKMTGQVSALTAQMPAHDRGVVGLALNAFADRIGSEYALDHSSTSALLEQVVALARRDAGLVVGA